MTHDTPTAVYTVAVQRNFVARHFLFGGDWGPENESHSHHYKIEIRLEGRELDRHGYLVDIVDIENSLDGLVAYFRDRTLNELAEFEGLNLTFETREGILKHCSAANARQLGELGARFLERRQPSLEAQLANLADAIAYNNHDVDDGIRAGLITIEELREITIFRRQHEIVTERYPDLGARRLVHEVVRRMIDYLVNDLISASSASIARRSPASVEDVRAQSEPLLTFSDEVHAEHLELKRYLREHLYRHYRVLRMTTKAKRVVRELFGAMLEVVELMPTEHQEAARRMETRDGRPGRARAVADYIAGMTDRFAILEHGRLFDPSERT